MRKHTYRRFIALTLVLIMAVLPLNALAANSESRQVKAVDVNDISEILKVKTVEDDAENPIVFISAEYSDLGDIKTIITVNGDFLRDCKEMDISIHLEEKKEPVYNGAVSIGEEAANVTGLHTETKYNIIVQGTHDISADSFIGYFILHEKDKEISVEYSLTHETYIISEYSHSYVKELQNASEMLQQANSKYDCLEKDGLQLNNKAIPENEQKQLSSASKLLSEYATRSVRYEVESNNTMASADILYDDDTMYGTIGYSGDVDYYKVKFDSAGNANFWLGSIPSGKDYDFYLYDASGNELKKSTGTSNQEQIYNYPVTANTWYYMKVIGYGGSYDASAQYKVRAKNYPTTPTPPTPPSGDSYEPNNTISAATPIPNNITLTTANIHTNTDTDFYRLIISENSRVRIILKNIPSSCDYDLKLLNSSSLEIATSKLGGTSTETIDKTLSPGVYYINVYPYRGSSNDPYRLLIATTATGWTTLEVSLVRQAQSNWCWAASLEMCATYLGYTEHNQWAIVREVKGDSSEEYPNLPGSADDYRNGMEFATENDYTATRTSTVQTLSQLNTSMGNSMPVILTIGRYDSNGTRTGHAVVCYAVNTSSNKLRVRDPDENDDYVEYYYPTFVSTEQTRRYDGTVTISHQ